MLELKTLVSSSFPFVPAAKELAPDKAQDDPSIPSSGQAGSGSRYRDGELFYLRSW